MTRGIFITAIGTECGKTHVAAALLRCLKESGQSPLAIKPLMSGFDPSRLAESDAGRLLSACGHEVTRDTIDAVCWKSFPEPLAPNVAARKSGTSLPYVELLAFVLARVVEARGPFLIEGAGGVMSPLTDTHTNIDLMTDAGLPVVLVAANYLGAVSHTLTALEALDRRSLTTVAIVVSQTAPVSGAPDPMLDELARWTTKPIFAAPHDAQNASTPSWADALSAQLFG